MAQKITRVKWVALLVEAFHLQVLFNPAKEGFDLPASFVDLADREGRPLHLIGEELIRSPILGYKIDQA